MTCPQPKALEVPLDKDLPRGYRDVTTAQDAARNVRVGFLDVWIMGQEHSRLKAVRGRGAEIQHHLATVRYLKNLEAEMDKVCKLIAEAWKDLDDEKQFRKCSRHMDAAQQRLHKTIKKLNRRKR